MPPVTLTDKNNAQILVLDPSASHLAYSFASVKNSTLMFEKVGMIWTHDKWTNGQKFLYMFGCFKILLQETPLVDSVYTESYFVNFNQKIGLSMIPTVNNIMQMAIAELDSRIGYAEISASTWRGALGIKAIKVPNGSRDYKTPTRTKVAELVNAVLPEKVLSNITGKLRDLPHDVTDCMAIALSVGKQLNCSKYELEDRAFLNPLLIDKLGKVKNNV